MIPRRAFLAALPALAACRGNSASGYHGHAFVACAGSRLVAVVDLLAFDVDRRIALPSAAHRLLRHPRPGHPRLFAYSLDEGPMLFELDTAALSLLRSVSLPGAALQQARLLRDPATLCFLALPASLLLVDPDSLRPVAAIPLAGPPHAFDIHHDTRAACVVLRTGHVQFIDLAARRAAPPVFLAPDLGDVRFRSDGRLAMVAERGRRLLTCLQSPTGAIVTQLPLALTPSHLRMKPDGGQLFITGEGRDAVVIVYPYRTEVAQTPLTGRSPGDMAVAEGPGYLFVANPQAGSVTVFDINTQRVVAVTGVGVDPGPIAITPDQQCALVLNRVSGDLAVIRIAAITPGRQKRAPLFTMIPVGAEPGDIRVVPA